MERHARVLAVVEDVLNRRRTGEVVTMIEVCRAYPDLQPDLRERLDALDLVMKADAEATLRSRDARANLDDQPLEGGSNGADPVWGFFNADKAEALRSLPIIDGYEIATRVGAGGQGVVYDAMQEGTGRRVAIKFVHPPTRGDGTHEIARFRREVLALGSLQHPNIAGVLGSGVHHGRPYCVLEFVDGAPLDEYVLAAAPTHQQVVGIFIKICSALQQAHLRGVIHRDLKPGNVLVDDAGEPHVVDFGLARLVDEVWGQQSIADTLTNSGQFVGTLRWASPEQVGADDGKPGSTPVDLRSDIYAVGVMLYEAITGEPPVDLSGSLSSRLHAIQFTSPRKMSRDGRPVAADLEHIVLKCLCKEAGGRYQSASELREDLRRFLDGLPVSAAPPSTWYRARSFVRRNRGVVASVGAVIVALAIGLGMAIRFMLLAQAERARADTRAYIAAIAAADAAIDNMDAGGARASLEAVPPHQRGWEWHHLRLLADGGSTVLYAEPSAPAPVLNPDGRTGFLRRAGRLVAFELSTARLLWETTQPADAVWPSADSRFVALHSQGRIEVRDAADGRIVGRQGPIPEDEDLADAAVAGGVPMLALAMRRPPEIRLVRLSPGEEGEVVWRRALPPETDWCLRMESLGAGGDLVILPAFHTLVVIDGRTGNERLRIEDPEIDRLGYPVLSASPDGRKVATGARDGIVVFEIDGSLSRKIASLHGVRDGLRAMRFDAESRRLVITSQNTSVRVWDFAGLEPARVLIGAGGATASASFTPSGSAVIAGDDLGVLRQWELTRNAPARSSRLIGGPGLGGARCLGFSKDSATCIAARGSRVTFIDLATGQERSIDGPWCDTNGKRVAICPATNIFVAPFVDESTRPVVWRAAAWRLGEPEPLWIDTPTTMPLWASAASADGRWAVYMNADPGASGDVVLRDAATGKAVRRLPAALTNGDVVEGLTFSPDGERLYASLSGAGIGMWRTDSETPMTRWDAPGPASMVRVAASADGKIIARACGDTSIVMLDAHDGRLLRLLPPCGIETGPLGLSPDGSRIAAGCLDNSVRLWDTVSGEQLLIDRDHAQPVSSIEWSPDGRWMAVGDRKGKLDLWFAPTASAVEHPAPTAFPMGGPKSRN